MRLIEHTYGDPACDIAFDELLLEELDQGDTANETLRLWNAQQTFVVMGRSGRVNSEVHLNRMQEDTVPLFRRCSGGGTIVAAPGCAFFSLVLSLEQRPELRMIDAAHNHVMGRLTSALRSRIPAIDSSGYCDLVVGDRKVSGNSLRIKRRALLYHGTFLLDMDLSLAPKYLQHPPREPDYRSGRPHDAFIQNLSLSADELRHALLNEFISGDSPRGHDSAQFDARVTALAESKYRSTEWTYAR